MGKKYDLEAEKQSELAAIWGSEVDGEMRYPQRRRRAASRAAHKASTTAMPHGRHGNTSDDDDNSLVVSGSDDDKDSDAASLHSSGSGGGDKAERRGALKRKRRSTKAATSSYRLHCFVEPGTDAHAVRMVLAAYEPKVEMRTAQKGNLLNRAHYAVLTFRNKAMALHAVQTLEGSDQRELLGVRQLHFNLMLTRQQSRVLRRRVNQQRRRAAAARAAHTASEELQFIEKFVQQHLRPRA